MRAKLINIIAKILNHAAQWPVDPAGIVPGAAQARAAHQTPDNVVELFPKEPAKKGIAWIKVALF